jgi:hypothetical protein
MIEAKTETFPRDTGTLFVTEAKLKKDEFFELLGGLGYPSHCGSSWTIRDTGREIVIKSSVIVPDELLHPEDIDEYFESDC